MAHLKKTVQLFCVHEHHCIIAVIFELFPILLKMGQLRPFSFFPKVKFCTNKP